MPCDEDEGPLLEVDEGPDPLLKVAERVPLLPEDNANAIRFCDFCDVLHDLSRSRYSDSVGKVEARLKLAMGPLSNKVLKGQSPYPYVRLLIPEADASRKVYNLAHAKLAKLYVRILGLEGTRKGTRLKHLCNPEINDRHPSDLGCTVQDAMRDYEDVKRSKLTLGEVNGLLDQLAEANDTEAKCEVLMKFKRTCSARDHKWLIRIILKSMKIRMAQISVLNYLHPDARNLFDACNDLRRVCSVITVKKRERIVAPVEFNTPFFPMLSAKLGNDFSAIMESLVSAPFLMELKLDGERMICHKDGDKIRCFTRNCKEEYTAHYVSVLTPLIRDNIKAKRCILDGEIMSWDSETGKMAKFGSNRTQAIAEKNLGTNNVTKWLFYVVFDIVYIEDNEAQEHIAAAMEDARPHLPEKYRDFGNIKNYAHGGSLVDLPLLVRRRVLERVLVKVPHRLEIVQGVEIVDPSLSDEERQVILFNYFDESAILRGEEGLLVKDLTAPYVLGIAGRRLMYWIKMKPDYTDQCIPLDVVIVGGFWGKETSGRTRVRSGLLTGFLMALKGDAPDPLYYTCGLVGSGCTNEQLQLINKKLKPYLLNVHPDNKYFRSPAFLWSNKNYRFGKNPGYFIDPKNSIVITVKFAEFRDHKGAGAGFTVRFPRIIKIRWDMSYDSIDTLESANQIRLKPRTSYTKVEPKKRKHEETQKRKKKKKPYVLPMHADQKSKAFCIKDLDGECSVEICLYSHNYRVPVDLLNSAKNVTPDETPENAEDPIAVTPTNSLATTVDPLSDETKMPTRRGKRVRDEGDKQSQNGHVHDEKPSVIENKDTSSGRTVQQYCEISRADLWNICIEHGATPTTVPGRDTSYVVADCWLPKILVKEDTEGDIIHNRKIQEVLDGDVRAKELISRCEYTVVDPTWVLSVAARKEYRFPTPAQWRCLSPALREEIANVQDDYGDWYLKKTDIEELTELFANMKGASEQPAGYDWRQAAIDKLAVPQQREIFDTEGTALWGPNVVAYVDMYSDLGSAEELRDRQNLKTCNDRIPMPYSSLTGTAYAIKLMGGHVSSHLCLGVTHVVMDPNDMRRARAIRERLRKLHTHREIIAGQWPNKRVVSYTWIDACREEHRPVEIVDDTYLVSLADL